MRRVSLWLPPALYMAMIFAFSAESQPLPAVTARVWDKLLHATEYAGLALLVARALCGEGLSWLAAALLAVVVASAYGVTDEYHQLFVPLRSGGDVFDWLADTSGAALGSAAWVAGRLTAASTASRLRRRLRPTPPGR
jgi:VanZ family protein